MLWASIPPHISAHSPLLSCPPPEQAPICQEVHALWGKLNYAAEFLFVKYKLFSVQGWPPLGYLALTPNRKLAPPFPSSSIFLYHTIKPSQRHPRHHSRQHPPAGYKYPTAPNPLSTVLELFLFSRAQGSGAEQPAGCPRTVVLACAPLISIFFFPALW